jgi:tRNA pseudouridine55 synthase
MDAWEPVSGVIVMDKPEGVSSAGMCRLVKGNMRARGAPKSIKVGHGGTLDPLATGVVVILVGKMTKRCDEVMAGEKEYLAGVDLSAFTASDDRETEREVVEVGTVPTIEAVRAASAGFVGEIRQVPPAYSAIKVGGRRAYQEVRAGRAVVMEARTVVIHEIRVVAYDWPLATLWIRCGKGVYIRSLARDLGVSLGTGGTLAWLRRTRVGEWTIRDALTPERWKTGGGVRAVAEAGNA